MGMLDFSNNKKKDLQKKILSDITAVYADHLLLDLVFSSEVIFSWSN